MVDEDAVREVIQFGVLAADHWHFRQGTLPMTEATRTRCLIETAFRHCIEQRLLSAPTRETIDAAYAAAEFGMLPLARATDIIPTPPPAYPPAT